MRRPFFRRGAFLYEAESEPGELASSCSGSALRQRVKPGRFITGRVARLIRVGLDTLPELSVNPHFCDHGAAFQLGSGLMEGGKCFPSQRLNQIFTLAVNIAGSVDRWRFLCRGFTLSNFCTFASAVKVSRSSGRYFPDERRLCEILESLPETFTEVTERVRV